jgi:hypothetical protein
MERFYTIGDLAEKYKMPYITAYKRVNSKYAEKRWGVQTVLHIDGTVKKVVPEKNLYLWEKNINYQGIPYED